MIDRLRDLLRSDDFVPTSSIFPEIDADKISRDLRLKDRGTTRGQEEAPPSDQAGLDGVEMDIVSRVEEARRRGLENYEHNRSVYSRRLRSTEVARLGGAGHAVLAASFPPVRLIESERSTSLARAENTIRGARHFLT